MSFCRPSRSRPGQFCLLLTSFLQRPGRPFADTLPAEATGRPVSSADDYWIPADRDLAMEHRLLNAIIARNRDLARAATTTKLASTA